MFRSAIFGVLFFSLSAVHAIAADAPAATPETRRLAKDLIAATGDAEMLTRGLEPISDLLSGQIALGLSLDAPHAAQVRTLVRQALSPAAARADEALVEAYAANLTPHELADLLAYKQSPTGQAEKAQLPLMAGELTAAMTGAGDAAETAAQAKALADAPKASRALAARILAVQGVEDRSRKGFAVMFAAMATPPAQAGADGQPAAAPSPAQAQQARETATRLVDESVRRVMAVEERFYATHFSETELTAMAAHLDSEPSRAVRARGPIFQRVVGKVMRDQYTIALASLDQSVCAAVACTPEQSARLKDITSAMRAPLPALDGL